MANEKKPLDIESLDVTELEDEALEDVSGGDNNGCPTTNTNCPCPQLPTQTEILT
jgi:hypothetical protein